MYKLLMLNKVNILDVSTGKSGFRFKTKAWENCLQK